MNYKGLAAALFLCAAFFNFSLPANAQNIASQDQTQFQLLKNSSTAVSAKLVKTPRRKEEPAGFNMLDTIWIASFAVAGLLILRKVQGE